MTPGKQYEPPTPAMLDPKLCHYCHKNKLDPKDRYFLPNKIEVCKECAAQHGRSDTSRRAKKGNR
jgi:hydrogenase maturation factor HypF (carbamoyltransferase family)